MGRLIEFKFLKNTKNSLEKYKLILLNKTNLYVYSLFIIVSFTCLILDFYFRNTYLLLTFLISTLISLSITYLGIPKLKEIKIKQIIRKEGPRNHSSKAGTPTMGGIFMIPIGLLIGNIININKEGYMIVFSLSLLTIFFMFIGLIDDFLSLKRKTNAGLSPNGKIILQLLISLLFLVISISNGWITEEILITNRIFNLQCLIIPLGLFVLLAESNSTNLTDGLDGLLSGCSVLIFTGFAIHLVQDNQSIHTSIARLCIAMAGTCIGFLFLNKNPAKIFMGDSGSLAIGACLGGIALISNSLWTLLIMGGIFAAESISVICQVSIYKFTKKLKGKGYRLFLMTPIHHHFELKGLQEEKIVRIFWLATLSLVILNLISSINS